MKKLIVLAMISLCVPAAIQARTTRPAFQRARQIKTAETLTNGKRPYTIQDIKTKKLTVKDGKVKTTVTTSKVKSPQELREIAQRQPKFQFGKGRQQFKDWQKKRLKPIRPVN